MNKELACLVSNVDLEHKFQSNLKQIKIMVYSQLNDYPNMFLLLPIKVCACFILLRTSDSSGHWTVICRNDDKIYYFDSYGVKPDGELSHISPKIRYELDESNKALTRLIKTIPKWMTFEWNNVEFQKFGPGINTCGKHCYVFTRCVFDGMTLHEYQARLGMLKHEYKCPYDNLICLLYDVM
jgi:hypothetical protein